MPDPGSLVCCTIQSTEELGRVVAVSGTTLTLACVVIEDGCERRTGRTIQVHRGNVWHVPTPHELRARAAAERAAALAVKAGQRSPQHYDREPAIREIDCSGFGLP